MNDYLSLCLANLLNDRISGRRECEGATDGENGLVLHI